MDHLLLPFLLLFATILVQPLGRRMGVAPAILMTAFGCLLALLPQVPDVRIDPELILPLVLPPLIYAAARRTSWRQFAASWGHIGLRAVGLVVATVVAVVAVFHHWYPALPLAAAVALGALVAPPDPVAVSALAGRLGLPRRLVAVLDGEGLFNDVTAIVIYQVAISAVVTGAFSAWGAFADLVRSGVVAVVVGWAIGWAGARVMRRLGEASWQVALSLALPFAAYLVTGKWHGSAVLAVLVCALYLTDAATDFGDRDFRVVGDSFWRITEMLVTGFAFGLIGLELSTVLRAAGAQWPHYLRGAAAVIAVVVGVRLVWLLATWAVLRGRRSRAPDPHTWRETVVTWWAGQRGVATVALALAVPLTTNDGAPFPGRGEILFTAFTLVLFTLLIQGPTLPAVVRATGVRADAAAEHILERELWTVVLRAELARLDELAAAEDIPPPLRAHLRQGYAGRLAHADPAAPEDARAAAARKMADAGRIRAINEAVVEAGRAAALAARRNHDVPPDVVDRVLRRLDR